MPLRRSLALLGLLALEVSILTISFEGAETLGASDNAWARLISHAHLIVPIGACCLTALILSLGLRFRGHWNRVSDNLRRGSEGWPYLPGHVAALTLFVLQTTALFQDRAPELITANGVFAWATAGLATLVFWGLCLVPPARILPVLRAGAPALAASAVGISAWWLAQLGAEAWEPLSRWTFLGVGAVLGWIYPEVICLPESLIVGTPSLTVHIAPACSGYQGVGLVLAFMAFYLWCFRGTLRFPQAFWLLPIAAGITWLANILRIAALIVVGNVLGEDVAVGGFHSNAGWIVFCTITLGIAAFAHRWRFIHERTAPAATKSTLEVLTAAHLLPFATLAAATLVIGAFTSEETLFLPLCAIPVVFVLWRYRESYRGAWGRFSGRSLVVGTIAFVAWIAFDPGEAVAAERDTLLETVSTLPAALASTWLAGRIIVMVLLAPIIEELAFRAYLTRRLKAANFTRVPPGTMTIFTVLVSSLAFGLMHDRWVAGSVVGALYAYCYSRARVAECVHAHAVTNGLLLVYFLV